MKVAITLNTPNPDAQLERRFGRCPYFMLVDTETRMWEPVQNPALNSTGGAGPQAAQFLADHAVTAVVSGEYGPKAFAALEAAGIQMYTVEGGDAKTLLNEFLAGRLERIPESVVKQRHGG